MSKFGERLRVARLAAGMSQERLGVEAGIQEESASARMNRYEKGTRMPAVEVAQKIARALNVPLSYLYADDDEEATLLLAFRKMDKKQRAELVKAITSAL